MFIVEDILNKLKNILKTDSKTKKVFDKELAEALDLTQANFATMKNRGKIPYTNILNFCAKRKISINWLLYNQNPNSLIDSTDRYWIKYYPTVNVSAGGAEPRFLQESSEQGKILADDWPRHAPLSRVD